MKATSDDQLHPVQARRRSPALLVMGVVVAALAAFLLLRGGDDADDSAPAGASSSAGVPAPPVAALPPAPDIPRQPVTVVAPSPAPAAEEAPEPAPPPTAEEADAMLLGTLQASSLEPQLLALLNVAHPLDVSVAMVDWLAQGVVPRKLLAVPALPAFPVTENDDGQLVMGDAAYARYDGLARAVAAADTAALAAGFHKLRPLLEGAYGKLGLDEDKFDNALIRALDQVLATPEIAGPIPLARKSVMYTYADPALEQLPDVQKQLLRMGPDNLRVIKEQARTLRQQLLAE
ncbi:MAG: DUF3014 domain-containing protein [Halioglobus sp.]